jgi:hypothetical protein
MARPSPIIIFSTFTLAATALNAQATTLPDRCEDLTLEKEDGTIAWNQDHQICFIACRSQSA